MQKLFSTKHANITVLLLMCLICHINSEVRLEIADSSTTRRVEMLDKFKLIAKDIVYLDYQREDTFLFNWLRGSEFDLENAIRRLVKSMEWRKDNRIDSLSQNPDILKFKKLYKYSVESVDKEGRPVLEYNSGRWDLRRITLRGKGREMQLYWTYMYEMALEKARNLTLSTGKNVSQFILLIDVDGFTIRSHACLSCLGLLGGIVQDFENNYAGFVHAFIMANAPRGFDLVLDFTKSLISPATKRALVVLPRDSNELKKYFSTIIDDDQLGREYGGKRNARGK